MRQKTGQWLPGAGGREEWAILFKEYRVSVWNDGKFLKMDAGDGCACECT